MKAIAAALLALTCAGCAASDGNPNGAPYANQPGGAIAAAPQDMGAETYDPYAPNPSVDSNISAPALGTNGGVPVKTPATAPYIAPSARPH